LQFRQELQNLINIIKELDRKVITIFLSVAVLQTISYYVTSRRFFRINFFHQLQSNPDVFLIEYLFWFIGDFFTFFVLAVLIIKFILKERLKDYGLTWGDKKIGLSISAIFIIVMLPAIWFFSAATEFVEKYPHLLSARANWGEFSIYETGMLIYMFSWEFIWRGFMLFGLKEKFGYYAVLIQMIPFVILHNGKPFAETFGAIAGGIALGILALRTNSFLYGVITHMAIMFSIDFICTLRFRANDYGVGLDSFLNLISNIF
jgi:membrane protease YdiL (CAAX protease family)